MIKSEDDGKNWTEPMLTVSISRLNRASDLVLEKMKLTIRHVWRAHSSDGAFWTNNLSVRLEGGDPAVIVKQNGNLLLLLPAKLVQTPF